MFDEIIFVPDPREPRNGFIGVDNDAEYEQISIQLGENGEFESDGGHSAILERRDDSFYELCLVNLETDSFETDRVFNDTYDPKAVCNQVERLFEDDHLQAHFVDGDSKPILIRKK